MNSVGRRGKPEADAGQAGADKTLAEKVKKGGQGVWGPIPMPPNPNVPDADLAAMVKYVLAQK